MHQTTLLDAIALQAVGLCYKVIENPYIDITNMLSITCRVDHMRLKRSLLPAEQATALQLLLLLLVAGNQYVANAQGKMQPGSIRA